MRIRFRRSVERSLAAITALMLWFGNPSAADKERWDSVSGLALQAFFADKQFADGVHFAYEFKGDGTFTGTEMGKRVSGVWRVQKDQFCWKWVRPPDSEECYKVQQSGVHVRMLLNGSEAWYGTLEKRR